ncbi:MAG: 6-carboxytetrahydropterin synthase QueD [Candidatus Omnitrophica bacterium]|nr:6-carboxytetrahydropterin synthase QueD [Candidatus Omnitrophota bacterium]
MAYLIEVTDTFSAAHQLRGYRGKCEHLHGHNWKVTVTLSAKKLDSVGLAIDFGEVKQLLSGILQKLDHTFLNDHPYFQKSNPSSENIARYIYGSVRSLITKTKVKVESVAVWESERTKAVYFEAAP